MYARLAVALDDLAMRQVEAFVTAFAANRGLSADDRARTLIVIEELITNLLKYGFPGEARLGTAEIALSLDQDKLAIELVDDGGAFDPFAAPAPNLNQPAAARPVGGLGLHIVRALTEGTRYQRVADRNVTQLILRLDLPLKS